MEKYFLSSRNRPAMNLLLDKNFHPLKEGGDDILVNATELSGTYHPYEPGFFGNYTFQKNEYFLFGNYIFNFSDLCWDISLSKVGDKNHFILKKNEKVIVDFKYTPESIREWDIYSDEEDDLLTLIHNLRRNPQRIEEILGRAA